MSPRFKASDKMALPEPIPTLDREDFDRIRQEMAEFELSEEREEQVQKHIDSLNENV